MRWLLMIYGYPYGFYKYKKDVPKREFSNEEWEQVDWIKIIEGQIKD